MDIEQDLKSFVELESESIRVDRSCLERFSVCPHMGSLIATTGDTPTEATESGQAVHDAYGLTISEFVASGGALSTADLREYLMSELRNARPDIQPDALHGGAKMAWEFCRELGDIGSYNLLRWDGGTGDNCGQLSHELKGLGVRITSELDMLCKTEAGYLRETDWKSGRKNWSTSAILDSFQFTLHAVLVFNNYPKIDILAVEVWQTREGKRTLPAIFRRDRLLDYETRIRSAAELYNKYRKTDPADVEAWPSVDKCSICPVAHRCHAAPDIVQDCAAAPPVFVDEIIRLDAKLSAMKKTATAYCDSQNVEIISTDGKTSFGRRPSGRKPPAGLHKVENNG